MSNALSHHAQSYISAWDVVQISGKDSADLLNRILTLDVKHLKEGHGSWAFLLDHRGQVKQSMWLLKINTHHFLAISEMDGDLLSEAIDLFVFSETLTIKKLGDCACVYQYHLDHDQDPSLDLPDDCDSFPIALFDRDREASVSSTERLIVGPRGVLESLELTFMNDLEFERYRVEVGGSMPSREYQSGTPLDVGKIGISEGKGCYPGQEVIERTIAIGKPAKLTISVELKIDTDEARQHLHAQLTNGRLQQPIQLYDLEKSKGAVIGEITSLSPPINTPSLDARSHESILAIAKLKSRFADFSTSLECLMDITERGQDALCEVTLIKR